MSDSPTTPSHYIIGDLQRTMVRIAANERWYEHEWLGVPIWQLPDDLMRLQRLVSAVRPRWIIETGTKFGGSSIFFASLMDLLQIKKGGVITCDITLLPEARKNLANHRFGKRVEALEGDAASPETVAAIRNKMDGKGPVLVFLDDNHNADHVLSEMNQYAPLITEGSYLVVADTVFEDLAGTPVGQPNPKYPDVAHSNPRVALRRFLENRNDFELDTSYGRRGLSNFPDGFLKRVG